MQPAQHQLDVHDKALAETMRDFWCRTNGGNAGGSGTPGPSDMPADQRLRPHDDERVTPIKQPGEEDQTDPSCCIDASGLDARFFIERQLTAQSKRFSASSERRGLIESAGKPSSSPKNWKTVCAKAITL